jgi:hypothetical protein
MGRPLSASKERAEKEPILSMKGVGFNCRAGFCSSTFQAKKALYILTLGWRNDRPMAGQTAQND